MAESGTTPSSPVTNGNLQRNQYNQDKENHMLAQIEKTYIKDSKKRAQKFSWKEYFVLVFAGLLGMIAALPAAWSVIAQTAAIANIPAQLLAAEQLIQSALWLLLAVGVGLWLSQKTGLGAPLLHGYIAGEKVSDKLRSRLPGSVLLAFFATLVVVTVDRLFFLPRMPGFSSAISQLSGWQGLLSSLYGGLTEEILTRLFLVTLLAWILSRFSHTSEGKPSAISMWIAIFGVALLFGLGHLPATLASTPFSTIVLARAILLNGILGVLFGYLYWKRGLESSMTAHFTSDLLVHVILPFWLL